MKRVILTLATLAVLLPLTAASARAGDDDRDDRRDFPRDRREIREDRRDDRRDDRRELRNDWRDDRRDDRREARGDRRDDDRSGPYRYRHVVHRPDLGRPRGVEIRTRGPVIRVDLGRLIFGERKRWVPGHYVMEERRVRLPDTVERVWVPDRYEYRSDACGRQYRVLVEEGHYVERVIPGRIVVRHERVWVPGHWEDC